MQSCRGALYVESSEGKEWSWYSPQQIPSLIAWLETGSQEEQLLAEQIYAMYQPVLKVVMHPKQVSWLRASLPGLPDGLVTHLLWSLASSKPALDLAHSGRCLS